jgi:catechol 2,3-dioxygenase-like lactoylglutathione lyase family enzyme
LKCLLVFALLGGVCLYAEVRPAAMGPISVTVGDLDRSVKFFTEVLSFEKDAVREAHLESFDRLTGVFGTNIRVADLHLGTERLQLVEYVTPQGRPFPGQSRSNDGWFQHIAIVVSDMDKAYERLKKAKVHHISTVPQTLPAWNPDAGGIKAFYFRDPDNHALELIWFPKGKGDPKWQDAKGLFVGIDHTAIAVSNTERSIKFYEGTLGLKVAGGAFNYGAEQENLNHVFGSRVRITGLRAPGGPGVEFLEYVTPTDGRPMPADTHSNDIWFWSSTVLVDDLGDVKSTFRLEPVSTDPLAAGKQGVIVRDPDGHAVLIRTR